MKNKLLELGLQEHIVDEILEVFGIYIKTIKRYDKPAGAITYKKNLNEIESLTKKLDEKLKALSSFERQMLMQSGGPEIRDVIIQIGRLSLSCNTAKNRKLKFSRREPFQLNLTRELWEVLERHEIPVTVYKNNVLCSILHILLNEKAQTEKGFHLLREASIYFKAPLS